MRRGQKERIFFLGGPGKVVVGEMQGKDGDNYGGGDVMIGKGN